MNKTLNLFVPVLLGILVFGAAAPSAFAATPEILSFSPADNATNVSVNVQPTLTFSEAIDTSTIKSGNIELRDYSTNLKVDTVLTYSAGNIVTFILSSPLEYNKQYYFFVGTGVKDVSGNKFAADTWYAAEKNSHEFTTEAATLSSAKDITAFSFPEGGGVISGINIAVTVPFGTDVTAIVPTIAITGASVSPASGVAQNFTATTTYTVTASDGLTQTYAVKVTVLEQTQTAPDDETGEVTIDDETPEVVITNPTQDVAVTISSGTTSRGKVLGASTHRFIEEQINALISLLQSFFGVDQATANAIRAALEKP